MYMCIHMYTNILDFFFLQKPFSSTSITKQACKYGNCDSFLPFMKPMCKSQHWETFSLKDDSQEMIRPVPFHSRVFYCFSSVIVLWHWRIKHI